LKALEKGIIGKKNLSGLACTSGQSDGYTSDS